MKFLRVLIKKDITKAYFQNSGDLILCDFPSERKIKSFKRQIFILIDLFGFRINWHFLKAKAFLIKGDFPIIFDQKPYYGDFLIVRRGFKFDVINIVLMKDYLIGVLEAEVNPSFHFETLKAQAVVSRSYAYYKIFSRKDTLYDIDATRLDQIYEGTKYKNFKIVEAVKKTEGIFLFKKRKIFPGFFSACCGGVTEKAQNVWENLNISSCSVICPFCKDSPCFSWRIKISIEEFESKLKKFGFYIKVKGIYPISFTDTGRVDVLKIKSKNDEKYIRATTLREILGFDILKSTFFSIKILGDEIFIEGRGWGHGVGLCQWGANKMAKKGYNFLEIIKFYFPKCYLLKL